MDAKTKHRNHGNFGAICQFPSFFTRCQASSRVKKGQFFLVGAIIIVLALYMLSNTLSKSTHIDCADVQDNNPIWTIEETEKGLYQITRKNLTERSRIDEFIGMQKEIANENGYALGFDMLNFMPYSGNPTHTNLYTITLESNKFYIEKSDNLLIYYSDCKAVDDSGSCDLIEPWVYGYKRTCCKSYGFCC